MIRRNRGSQFEMQLHLRSGETRFLLSAGDLREDNYRLTRCEMPVKMLSRPSNGPVTTKPPLPIS